MKKKNKEKEKDNEMQKLKEENLLLKRVLEAVIKEYLNMSTTHNTNTFPQTITLQQSLLQPYVLSIKPPWIK